MKRGREWCVSRAFASCDNAAWYPDYTPTVTLRSMRDTRGYTLRRTTVVVTRRLIRAAHFSLLALAPFCFNTSTSHDWIGLSSLRCRTSQLPLDGGISRSQLPASLGYKFYSQLLTPADFAGFLYPHLSRQIDKKRTLNDKSAGS